MAKPEWGFKRICLNCAAKFYDMQKSPIVCPSCETVYDPEAATKLKRGRHTAADTKAKAKPAAAAAEESTDEDDLDDDLDDDVDDSVLEDTSDLGDDDVPVPTKGGDKDDL